ncbi:hypothetical protein GH865_06915 [Rhodocyclus tenuis]|uniref:substrate-binding domain-containing protein n=1 Tax=Rhodocyclus gracilis TaxID=2929842 RepID=UPI001298A092|nr:substrate-binding domain-containing protein [Rhodocyclus gracilis]MRD72982.1 hypothetical protein [Rhodocyclus gracilis]
MKMNKLAALCAIACAGLAGNASAAGLSTAQKAVLDDANSNGRVIYVAGASAVQKGFGGIVAKLFVPGTVTWYGSAQDTTGSDYFAVAGQLAADAGSWAGQNAIFIERVVGGSVYGVNSVARAESIDTLQVTSSDCGTAGTGVDAKTAFTCTVGAKNAIPDAGISDVAPVFFQSPTNTEGETAAAALDPVTELPLLTSTAIYGLAFGPAVTTTVPTTVKFTKANIAAILSGGVGTWDQVAAGLSGDIVVCRRTPGSGTQAVFNAYFGNYPCTGNYNVPADRYASSAWSDSDRTFTVSPGTGGLVVVENASSGDVKNCLNAAVNGPGAYDATKGAYANDYVTRDRNGKPVKVHFTAAGNKAIGVLSMDSLNGSTTTSKWTFRNLDGAGQITWTGNAADLPVVTGSGKNATVSADGTSGNYIDGTWDLQAWESFNIPARTTGPKLEVLNKFLTLAQDPAVHAAVPALKYVTAGIPGNGYTGARVLQAAYLNGDQCAPYNKQ